MLFNLTGKRVKGIYLNQIMINMWGPYTMWQLCPVADSLRVKASTPVSEAPGVPGPCDNQDRA